jgi:hypothetical protein
MTRCRVVREDQDEPTDEPDMTIKPSKDLF